MSIDYKQLLKRYVATVRRYNVGEDFITTLARGSTCSQFTGTQRRTHRTSNHER